jgi:hypothetical protein
MLVCSRPNAFPLRYTRTLVNLLTE